MKRVAKVFQVLVGACLLLASSFSPGWGRVLSTHTFYWTNPLIGGADDEVNPPSPPPDTLLRVTETVFDEEETTAIYRDHFGIVVTGQILFLYEVTNETYDSGNGIPNVGEPGTGVNGLSGFRIGNLFGIPSHMVNNPIIPPDWDFNKFNPQSLAEWDIVPCTDARPTECGDGILLGGTERFGFTVPAGMFTDAIYPDMASKDGQGINWIHSWRLPGEPGDQVNRVFGPISGPVPLVCPIPVLILDLRLTGCINCRAGDLFGVEAHVENPLDKPVFVEVKLGIRLPDGTGISLSNLANPHFTITLPPHFTTTVPVFTMAIPAGTPVGNYAYEGVLLDPTLGQTLAQDREDFRVE